MATHHKEVLGTVIGYGVVVNPESPAERRIHFTTCEEWEDLNRRCDAEEFEGMLCFTRILGPNGIEEQEGVNVDVPPPGYKLQKLTCECGESHWFALGGESNAYQCYACTQLEGERRLYAQDLAARLGYGDEDDIGL